MAHIYNNTIAISPFSEMAAYEAIWDCLENPSFKKVSEYIIEKDYSTISEAVENEKIAEYKKLLLRRIKNLNLNALIDNTFSYPSRLKDAKHPVKLLYFTGNLQFLETRSVSIVGTRNPTLNGIKRTQKLAKLLVQHDFTIFSGLAQGIDTAAHTTAIQVKGRTVAVIGTPIDEYYPRNNKELQDKIAKDHLLISQVPFIKTSSQDYRRNRVFFPERNKTMAALSDATIIVEAGNTSGALVQAKAALEQNRKLFILQNCFDNKDLTWPSKLEKKGAIRVREFNDILNNL